MNKSLKRTLTLTKRNIKEIIRDPLTLIFMIGLPLLMEVLFYFMFNKLTAQFEIKYLAPGIVVFAQAFLSLFVGLLIALDRSSSFLTRLYVSETKSSEFICSYMLSLLPLSLLQSILFFLVGGILDPSFFSLTMIVGVIISCFSSLLFIGVGILIGCLCNEKSVGGVASIVIAGQSVLSGMWFPTEGMGNTFLTIMRILPFKNSTELIQNSVNGINNTWSDFLLPFIIVLGYSIIIYWCAILTFKRKMKK